MSANASTVCRLLGGSGRPALRVVRTKIPALLAPLHRPAADVVVLRPEQLPLAA